MTGHYSCLIPAESHFLFLLAAGMRDDSLALLFRPATLALLDEAVIR